VGGQAVSDEAFIELAFEAILTRRAQPPELRLCLQFLVRQTAIVSQTEATLATRRARESLVRALLNHNDFMAIR
jgi:hypothetical protein